MSVAAGPPPVPAAAAAAAAVEAAVFEPFEDPEAVAVLRSSAGPPSVTSRAERGTTANRRSEADGYGRRAMPTTVAVRPSTIALLGMDAPARPEDRDPRPADEQLRLPAIAGAMDVDDVAADADQPPFVGGARRDRGGRAP